MKAPETEPKKSSKMPANGCASALHHTAVACGVAGGELFTLLVSGQPAKQKAGRADQKLLKIMHQLTDTTVLGIY